MDYESNIRWAKVRRVSNNQNNFIYGSDGLAFELNSMYYLKNMSSVTPTFISYMIDWDVKEN